MTEAIDITVVVPTYNRCDQIGDAMNSVLRQRVDNARFELVVVDNNSCDDTSEVVQRIIERADIPVRYYLERKQGVSYARNTGIAKGLGSIVAFMDDDIRAGEGWLSLIKKLMDQQPDLAFLGGKVLPDWQEPPSEWLTRDHWSPLALLDYGERPITIDDSTSLGLITSNLAIRRSVLTSVGCFSPELQRVKDSIGSMEDHELLDRVLRSGARGLYVPDMVVTAQISPDRLTRAYHRRWHFQHGSFYAIYRSPHLERTSRGRFLDVPAHMYRQMISDLHNWVKSAVLGRSQRAFMFETRLRFFAGFVSRRVRNYLLGWRRRRAT